jgi:hypothetical protein
VVVTSLQLLNCEGSSIILNRGNLRPSQAIDPILIEVVGLLKGSHKIYTEEDIRLIN